MSNDPPSPSGPAPGPAAGHATGPAIDWMHLLSFAGGDEDFARETVAFFVENVGGYLTELEAQSEWPGWRDIAHKLKGAARSVGAFRLADLAETAEKTDAEAWQAARDGLCAALRDELARVGEAAAP